MGDMTSKTFFSLILLLLFSLAVVAILVVRAREVDNITIHTNVSG